MTQKFASQAIEKLQELVEGAMREVSVMKLGNITDYSAKLLKGSRVNTMLIVLAVLSAELFFRIAEAALYSLMLYFGTIKPAELFIGKTALQYLISAVFTALRYITAAPLIFTAACRFTGLSTGNAKLKRTPLSGVLLSRRLYRRSLASLLLSKLAGVIFMLPATFFGYTAFSLISDAASDNSPTSLFMSVHAGVMTLLSVGLWIWAKLSLMTVPFLMVYFPEKKVSALAMQSIGFMKGRRAVMVKLFAYYGIRMLPVVTIPAVLPELFSAVSLCIDIFIKEDEYREGNSAGGRHRQTAHTSKLPAWAKRCFKTPSDKAQTAGYGNNL